MLRMLPLVRR